MKSAMRHLAIAVGTVAMGLFLVQSAQAVLVHQPNPPHPVHPVHQPGSALPGSGSVHPPHAVHPVHQPGSSITGNPVHQPKPPNAVHPVHPVHQPGT